MTCTRCGNDEVPRSRRRGVWDAVQRALGKWPYRCEDCNYRFFSRHRYPQLAPEAENLHRAPAPEFGNYTGETAQPIPEMAFQTHTERPHAKIVVQADTHEQLNHILLALNRAVTSYGTSTRPETASHPQPENARARR